MFDPQHIMLRSLRYHAPTEELRNAFYVKGNTVFCSKPSLLTKYNNTDTNKEQNNINVNSYIRKANKKQGTGLKRIRGYKRQSTQQSLEERLFQAESPKPFLPTAISYGVKNIYKYLR